MLARLVRVPERSNWREPGRTIKVVGYAAEPDTAASVFAPLAALAWERGFTRWIAIQGMTKNKMERNGHPGSFSLLETSKF